MQQNLIDIKIPYKTKEIYNGYSIFTSMKTTLLNIQKKEKKKEKLYKSKRIEPPLPHHLLYQESRPSISSEKIGFCLFLKNNPAFCPLSQTN